MLNAIAANEHVLDIKRQIQVIKENDQSIYNSLPYNKIPNRITAHSLTYAIFLINKFLVSSGVSTTFSPFTIMKGVTVDFSHLCHLEFGTYAELHESTTPTNSQQSCT